MDYIYKQLSNTDTSYLKGLLKVFGEAFEDVATYQKAIPDDTYLKNLLSKEHFIVLVVLHEDEVVGGLAAYELEKFEQNRREIYIYDLAVSQHHRRKGIATKLINELKNIAIKRNTYVIFVQADQGDLPAIKLYQTLGSEEEVLHFDISPDGKPIKY